MGLHNIIAQGQAQASALPCWRGGKKGLEDLVQQLFWDAVAIIPGIDCNLVFVLFKTYPNGRPGAGICHRVH